MNVGDFILIDYVGRVKDSGEIFDLTKEDVAKENKIFDEKFKYKPITLIIDSGLAIKGLNDAVKNMDVGGEKTVEIEPKDAFGERKTELIKLIPPANFKDQNVDPTPGSYITINNVRGRIVSNNGGRIRVDFNHPLAGKKLEYNIETIKLITETKDKIKSVIEAFASIDDENLKIDIIGDGADISLGEMVDMPKNVKKSIADTILKHVKELKNIRFVDMFETKKD